MEEREGVLVINGPSRARRCSEHFPEAEVVCVSGSKFD